jgi:hypothetical protein
MPLFRVTKTISAYVLAKNAEDARKEMLQDNIDDDCLIDSDESDVIAQKISSETDIPKHEENESVYVIEDILDHEFDVQDYFDLKKVI